MRRFQSSYAGAFFILMGWGLGCSTAPSTPSKEERHSHPSSQSSKAEAENKELREIEALYNRGDLTLAETKGEAFRLRHPKSSLLPSVENLLGLVLYRSKRPAPAIEHFKKALELNPSNVDFNQYILYNLASAQLDAHLTDDAQKTANQIRPEALDKSNRLKLYFLKANLNLKKSLPLEAARQALSAGRLLTETDLRENRKALDRLLEESLQMIGDIPLLEKLYQEFEDSPVADVLLFRLGSQEMLIGNRGNGEVHLRILLTRFPQSSYYAQATELLKGNQTRVAVDSRSIGVLLPVKGKLAKFGLSSLQGIQLALGIFNTNDPDSQLNLVIEDSGEETEQAIRALDRLVLKHHVVAVIGPMMSKGIDQISQRAQELGVPLLSIARRASSPKEYVFQAGLTQQLQAYEAARYAIQKLGAKRFAIVFPNDKTGTEMSMSFWDAVESMGGKIVGAESYAPNETDFRHSIDRLAGVFYQEARQRELDLLAQERDANNIKKKTRKTEQFYKLLPIVDFDAVFIPGEPKAAGQILPTFAYRDIDNIKFLGTSAWNSPEFLTRAQNYGENSTFVDAFFPSPEGQTKVFIDKFKNTYGQEPSAFEAIAYDAGLILRSVLTSASDKASRSDIRDALTRIKDFQGVTGTMSYRDGQFFRNLKAITVKSGRFVLAP